MAYSGEHDAKRLARILMYTHCADAFRKNIKPSGYCVTLTGPDAAEVGCMRHILHWPPEKCIFVDLTKGTAAVAEKRMPNCMGFECDIRQLAEVLDDGIGFVHLDLMGQLGRTAVECIKALKPLMKVGSIFMYTYLRGREKADLPIFEAALPRRTQEQWLRKLEHTKPDVYKHYIRRTGTLYALKAYLGDDTIEQHFIRGRKRPKRQNRDRWRFIDTVDYTSTSPMSVIALQKLGPSFRANRRLQLLKGQLCIIPRDALPHVKRLCGELYWRGCDTKIVAECLNVNPHRVRAWAAHLTRGNYYTGEELRLPIAGFVRRNKKKNGGGAWTKTEDGAWHQQLIYRGDQYNCGVRQAAKHIVKYIGRDRKDSLRRKRAFSPDLSNGDEGKTALQKKKIIYGITKGDAAQELSPYRENMRLPLGLAILNHRGLYRPRRKKRRRAK